MKNRMAMLVVLYSKPVCMFNIFVAQNTNARKKIGSLYRDVNTHFEYAHNYEYFYIVAPNAVLVQTILRRCGKMQRQYVCGTNEEMKNCSF